MAVSSGVVLQQLLKQGLIHGRLGRDGQHLAAKIVDVRHAAVDARFLLRLGNRLVRVLGGQNAEILVILKIGAVKAVQACHLGTGNLVKDAPLSKQPAHAGSQGRVKHLGLAAQHNGHLHLVHVVNANAGGVVGAGKAGEKFGQAGDLQALLGNDVPLAQGDNLLADVDAVPLLKIGQNILAQQPRQVVAYLDQLGVNGAAVILLAVHL